MKRLITILTLLVISLGAFAQADSLARTMNGFYKWNGEQFYTDTIWTDTSMFDVSTGNLQLSLDTVGSSASGYYKIIATESGSGSIKGSGTPLEFPFMTASDSVESASFIAADTVNQRLKLSDVGTFEDIGRLSFYSGDSLRFTIDTARTVFNEQDPQDWTVLDSAGLTALSVDVSARRIGVNALPVDLGASLTIGKTGSDEFLKFVEPTLVSGANTPSFNTAPTSGAIRWLTTIVEVGGVEQTVYIPLLLTP